MILKIQVTVAVLSFPGHYQFSVFCTVSMSFSHMQMNAPVRILGDHPQVPVCGRVPHEIIKHMGINIRCSEKVKILKDGIRILDAEIGKLVEKVIHYFGHGHGVTAGLHQQCFHHIVQGQYNGKADYLPDPVDIKRLGEVRRDSGVQRDKAFDAAVSLPGKFGADFYVWYICRFCISSLNDFIDIQVRALEVDPADKTAGAVAADNGFQAGNVVDFFHHRRQIKAARDVQVRYVCGAFALQVTPSRAPVIAKPGIKSLLPEVITEIIVQHGVFFYVFISFGPIGNVLGEGHI